MTCDPCGHCVHAVTWYDRENGWEDFDCSADAEWEGDRPCPSFRPVLASEGLYEQLWEEVEYRCYMESCVAELERKGEAVDDASLLPVVLGMWKDDRGVEPTIGDDALLAYPMERIRQRTPMTVDELFAHFDGTAGIKEEDE